MNVGAVAAKTSRFPTAARRRSWIAAQALAVVALSVFSLFGLPHFVKTIAKAKTIAHATTQLPSLPVAQNAGVAHPNTGSAPITPPEPPEIPKNDPASRACQRFCAAAGKRAGKGLQTECAACSA